MINEKYLNIMDTNVCSISFSYSNKYCLRKRFVWKFVFDAHGRQNVSMNSKQEQEEKCRHVGVSFNLVLELFVSRLNRVCGYCSPLSLANCLSECVPQTLRRFEGCM